MDGKSTTTVYMCGPIAGLTYEDAVARRSEIAGPLMEAGVRVLTPMRGKHRLTHLKGPLPSHGYKMPEASDRFIIHRDFWDVTKRADIIIADFRGFEDDASIGSVFELAWAYAFHVYVIMLVNDKNHLGKYGHAFVKEAVGIVFDRKEDVIELVLRYSGVEI